MGPRELASLLLARRRLAARLRWTPARLAAHRASALAVLRAHAYARSPFYRDSHAGLTDTPLDELPVLTKADLMANFDALVTDPEVRLAEIERHLETASATDRYLGRYRVAATGGTSGRRGVFLADPAEWIQILASYGRAYAWAGLPVGLTHPLRMAIVSSTVPTHQSSIVGATVRNPLVTTLRVDATDPLQRTVEALNDFRPQALIGSSASWRPSNPPGGWPSRRARSSAPPRFSRRRSGPPRRPPGDRIRTTSTPRPRPPASPRNARPTTCTPTTTS